MTKSGRSGLDRALMLEVLRQFRTLLRSMDIHYRQVERRSGLGGAQLWALAETAAPGGLTVGDLAAKLAIHISTASNLVSRLEELGLVSRSRGKGDKRVVRLSVTAAGRRRLARAPGPHSGVLQDALLRMGEKELRALHTQLRDLLEHVRRIDRTGAAKPLGEMLGGPLRGN